MNTGKYIVALMVLTVLFGGLADAKVDNSGKNILDGKAWLNLSYHVQSIGQDRVMVKIIAENVGTITAKEVSISLSNYINAPSGQRIVTVGIAPIDKIQYGAEQTGKNSVMWKGELKPKEKHEIKFVAKTGDLKGGYFLTQLGYRYLKAKTSRFGHTINLREGKGDVVCSSCVP